MAATGLDLQVYKRESGVRMFSFLLGDVDVGGDWRPRVPVPHALLPAFPFRTGKWLGRVHSPCRRFARPFRSSRAYICLCHYIPLLWALLCPHRPESHLS